MIVTPELNGLNRPERNIAPPMQLAITIPLAIDGRHSMHDGYIVYVCQGGFDLPKRDTPMVLKAIAKAIAEQLGKMPPFEV